MGVLRPIDFTKSELRQLLPGMTYELPPGQEGKVDPLLETREHFLLKAETAGDRPSDKFLLGCYRGISPLVARELSFLATGHTDSPACENPQALFDRFSFLMEAIKEERFDPCILQVEGKNVE